jgi:hypothetical protein
MRSADVAIMVCQVWPLLHQDHGATSYVYTGKMLSKLRCSLADEASPARVETL